MPYPLELIVDFAIGLARIKPKDVKFVIMDGSTADGSDRRYSDYDVTVVRKGLSKKPGSAKDFFGVFNGRLLSAWLLDAESFKHRYIGEDDKEFLWRRRGLSRARLLFGNKEEFDRITRNALSRQWNRKRQMAVIEYSYMTMVEYMGKMLNKVDAHEAGTPEFYQDGYILATNTANLVAALNKIDLDSDKTMYRQIFREARIKPPNFERDLLVSSGLTSARRNAEEVLSASRRLLKWSRGEILHEFGPVKGRGGLWAMVREMKL
jgi:predicted nucleotidyltransferase